MYVCVCVTHLKCCIPSLVLPGHNQPLPPPAGNTYYCIIYLYLCYQVTRISPHPLQMVTHTIILYNMHLLMLPENPPEDPPEVNPPHPQMVTYTIIMYDMPLLVPPDHQPPPANPPPPAAANGSLHNCIMQTISLTFLFSEILQAILEQISSMYL